MFHGKQVPVELSVHVLACLAEGVGMRATARVCEVAPNTVRHWLVDAAEQLTAFSASFLCDVHGNQRQLDALSAGLSAVKAGELREAKAIKRVARSPHGVWTAIDPVTHVLRTIDGGPRTLAMAQCVGHHGAQRMVPDCVPLFLTDGHQDSWTAILTHVGHWVQAPRRQARGPAPKPRWMPLPR